MNDGKHARTSLARGLSTLALFCGGVMTVGGAGIAAESATAVSTENKAEAGNRGATPAAGAASHPFKSEKEKQSYAMGMILAGQLRNQSQQVDPENFMQGLKDALSSNKMLLSESESRATLASMQSGLKQKQNEVLQRLKQDEDAFLAENKTKEGIVALESGLQYKILKAGDGKRPSISDTVVCNYRGSFINGSEFDSSYKRNRPSTFAVNRVIKGWTEALQRMPAGSTWQLFVPAHLAYGEKGAGRTIGPGSTLVFEVELISVADGAAPRADAGNDSIAAADSTHPNGKLRRKKANRTGQSPVVPLQQTTTLPGAGLDVPSGSQE